MSVEVEDKVLVIDTGPDFRQQILREKVGRLDAVLLTHGHRDHIAGLDDIRAFNHIQSRDMPIYGQREALDRVRVEFDYAFAETTYPGLPQLQLHEVGSRQFEVDGIKVIPLPVKHHKLPVLGFRIGGFSYITDANSIPDATLSLLEGTDTLVLNALQREKHISHFNLEEAVAAAEKIGAKNTLFTHISHKLGLHKEVNKMLPPTVSLAYDGLTIAL